MSLVKKIVSLKNLLLKLKENNLTNSATTQLASEAILGFFIVAENNETPTNEEKLEILKLVNDVSNKLTSYVDTYKARFELGWDADEELTCQLHSGLQFLKDDYIDLLIDQLPEENMKESIKMFVDSLDFDELNEYMKKWNEKTVCYHPPKPRFVPSKHFWWQNSN